MTLERGSVSGIENIKHDELASLLEPVEPGELLHLTAHLSTTLGKLSDMGYRTMKGDALEYSNGVLTWQSAVGDIGHGEEIAYGWRASDETALFSAELQILGCRAPEPRRTRFDLPGFPRTSVSISTLDTRRETPNVKVVYQTQGKDLARYEVNIKNSFINNKNLTWIRLGKRTRGFQREMTFFYTGTIWRRLHLAQESLVRRDVYDALVLLNQSIHDLYSSKYNRDEIIDILVRKIRQRALSFKDLVKTKEAKGLKDAGLGTYAEWINDEHPDTYSALARILELTGMDQQGIDRCILAVQSGSDNVPTPWGQLNATFDVKRSSAANKPTRFLPPKTDSSLAGIAKSLSAQWLRYSAEFTKRNFDDFLLLEGEISSQVFGNLAGIKALVKNGVRFKANGGETIQL